MTTVTAYFGELVSDDGFIEPVEAADSFSASGSNIVAARSAAVESSDTTAIAGLLSSVLNSTCAEAADTMSISAVPRMSIAGQEIRDGVSIEANGIGWVVVTSSTVIWTNVTRATGTWVNR